MAMAPAEKDRTLVVERKNLTGLDGAYTSYESKNVNVDVSKTGYRAIGMVAYGKTGGSGSTNIVLSSYNVTNNHVVVYNKNITSNAANAEGTYVDILYQPI